MIHYYWWKRLKKFMMRRQSVLGVFTLMLFHAWLHPTNVDNQDESGETFSNAHKPSYFFPKNSTILDLPLGNEEVLTSLMPNKALFVMFYAPWSVQCLQARDQFNDASLFFSKRVQFAAINCWYDKGTCRKKHSLTMFPTFYFYNQDSNGFRYTGVPRFDLLARFVELMLDPVEVINSEESLMSFLHRHEISVVSFFDFASSYKPLGFSQFYLASLKFIESDPTNILRFAVTINSSVASLLSLHSVSSMSLMKGTVVTHKYNFQVNTSAESLFQWINYHKAEPSIKWLQISKMKSLMLSSELRKGPALLLFVPYFPLSLQHEAFIEMCKVSRAYYNCNGTTPIWRKSFEDIVRKNKERNDDIGEVCRNYAGQDVQSSSESLDFVKIQKCCQFVIKLKKDICIEMIDKRSYVPHVCNYFGKVLNVHKHLIDLYPGAADASVCFELKSSYFAESQITVCNDPRSGNESNDFGRRIRQRNLDDFVGGGSKCPRAETHSERGRFVYGGRTHGNDLKDPTGFGSDSYPDDFLGSGCRSNQSVRFYAVDFVENNALISHFGFNESSPPSLFFADVKKEILQKLDGRVSESVVVRILSLYKSDSISSHFRIAKTRQAESAIAQVTSINFNEVVRNDKRATMLLYYSKWCGFCITFGHIYISLAEYFSPATDLNFARIESDSNDVYLQYTAPHYPSVVFFSRNNGSIPYMKHYPRSLSSLLKFIQKHLSNADLRSLESSCNRLCIDMNLIALRKKLRMFVQKIDLLRFMLSSRNSVDETSDLGDDERTLKKELVKKMMQLDGARFLFKVLSLPVTGQYLEKHKLALLTEKFLFLRTKLKVYMKYY